MLRMYVECALSVTEAMWCAHHQSSCNAVLTRTTCILRVALPSLLCHLSLLQAAVMAGMLQSTDVESGFIQPWKMWVRCT